MKVLFTGATGVLGHETIPLLTADGHDVTAVVRPSSNTEWFRTLGVRTIVLDLFDPTAVHAAVAGHDAVVHFATSIPPASRMTRRKAWEMNDRLRRDATRHLVDGTLLHDVGVFIQESVTFVYADGGRMWLTEDAPVEPVWDVLDSALEAESHAARVTDAGGRGVVLRLARLYGPESTSAEFLDSVSARKVPIVGSGDNYVSYLHAADAGRAVVAAVDAPAGVYNVSDGSPVTTANELAFLSDLLGVDEPRRIPYPIARTAAGRAARLLAVSHRIAADRFRAVTGWAPSHSSVRDGWPEIVARRRTAA